jgi:hypothetical protein
MGDFAIAFLPSGSDLEWLEHAAGEKLLRNPREQ